jgi:hypothetical protein
VADAKIGKGFGNIFRNAKHRLPFLKITHEHF